MKQQQQQQKSQVDKSELGDSVDNHIYHHAHRRRLSLFHHPFDMNLPTAFSLQYHHRLEPSFSEVIHDDAVFPGRPNKNNTNSESILPIRGGGSDNPKAKDCGDVDYDHSELANFLNGTDDFNFASGIATATTTTVMTAAVTTDENQKSEDCFDHSEFLHHIEGGSVDCNFIANATTTTSTDNQESKDHCHDDLEFVKYLEGSELVDYDPNSPLVQVGFLPPTPPFTATTTSTMQFLEHNGKGEKDASSQQLREYTLRQWIMSSKHTEIDSNSKRDLSSMQPKELSNKYIKSALMIALKLTECILEAENEEHAGYPNPIPLASIAPDNVLIRARRIDCLDLSCEGREDNASVAQEERIEYVWVMSFLGDDLATGTVMSRLFAVGKVLYELLSTNEPLAQEDDSNANMVSMSSMNISGCEGEIIGHRPQKRSHRLSARGGTPDFICRLESAGVPWSLCFLIKNLLDCQHDPFIEDNAYTSFTDLHLDLKLMIDNPSCFLDNFIHNQNYVLNLSIEDKLYGRDFEMKKIEELYQHHIKGENETINGTIISGAAGVGKSTLARYLQILTNQSNGYFLSAKFEQNKMSPLSTLVQMFETLCEMIADDSSQTQLMMIGDELTRAIGSESHLLGILPSLKRLMPSSVLPKDSTSNCIDSAVSMRYMFAELFHVISSHLKPITLLMDDVQYADHASLLLIANLLFSAKHTSGFFAICHRDDEASMSGPFHTWLSSISILSLEKIHLESILPEGVNDLVSDTFHLSPRITRPLSSVLHNKTRGNPLFLRQLLISLTEQGYIYVDWSQHRWAWDLDKIMELEISDSVLALLMKEIQRLPEDMKFGLQAASCIGSKMTESMLVNLSNELGLDLIDIFRQLSQKGFMIDIAGATMFRFAHDKIQQAAYELIPDHERRSNHMRIGLALCNQTLDSCVENDEHFFIAVNQINQGGPAAVLEPSQKYVLAELNLKAGRRSIDLSDCNAAFAMFQHGLSFLGEDSWAASYRLTLDLHDSLTDVAMILNKPSTVQFYADKVVAHAKCFDDKLNCLCNSVQALAVALDIDKSIETSFGILLQFGEELPREMGDETLQIEIDQMTFILQSTSDVSIYDIHENTDKKMAALFNLYVYLAHALHYFKPWLFGSVTLRMMEITLNTGLSPMSPLAFAHFGSLSVTIGYVTVGCRLGKIALKLLERKGSLQYKSKVINFVYDGIFWACEPLQSIVDWHLQGYKAGQLSGDIIYGVKNLLLATTTDYVAGQNLDAVRNSILDFVSNLQRHGVKLYLKLAMVLLTQIMVLKAGLHMSQTSHLENMPSEGDILADASTAPKVFLYSKVHHLTRAFLFRQTNDASLKLNISRVVVENHHQLDATILMGYFFEGLASFLLARQSLMNRNCIDGVESSTTKLMTERGLSVLKRMRCWSEHSCWNWEDKMLLLEAEYMNTRGDYIRASSLYDSAIRSAHFHKFIHEEAIASELAAIFYHERGMHMESFPYFVHAVKSYNEWGAHAVANRVESFLRDVVFIHHAATVGNAVDISWQQLTSAIAAEANPVRQLSLGHLFALSSSSSLNPGGGKKKRHDMGEL